jgi:hypothetical protein
MANTWLPVHRWHCPDVTNERCTRSKRVVESACLQVLNTGVMTGAVLTMDAGWLAH